MKIRNRWFFTVLTGCLLGSSLLMPCSPLLAAPALEKADRPQALVSINKADASELESIRGIGPLLAQRITEYRQANGRFESLEDLIRVPGIGQAKFGKIKDQITL